MQLDFTADQDELRDSVRSVLGKECPITFVRTHVDHVVRKEPSTAGSDLFATLAALDWPALTVPEASGGVGLGPVELAILAEELGLTRDGVYITNTVKCRPPGNRDPLPVEVATCRSYLENQIDLVAPRVIITLGNFAARLLLDTTAGVSSLRGRSYPYGGRDDLVVVPTFHPAYVLRNGSAGESMAATRADFIRAKEHLAVSA